MCCFDIASSLPVWLLLEGPEKIGCALALLCVLYLEEKDVKTCTEVMCHLDMMEPFVTILSL